LRESEVGPSFKGGLEEQAFMTASQNLGRREKALNVIALASFILIALLFIALLYYSKSLGNERHHNLSESRSRLREAPHSHKATVERGNRIAPSLGPMTREQSYGAT
jgi:hypothetical protein